MSMNNIKECDNCKYYDDGVCCNSDSANRADFVMPYMTCEHWTEVKENEYDKQAGD